MNSEIVAAVEKAIAETHVQRYRWLALEQPDESQRRVWQAWIMAGRPMRQPEPLPFQHEPIDPATIPERIEPFNPCGGCR